MKKTITALLVLVMCIGLLAGCGGSKTETPAPGNSGNTGTQNPAQENIGKTNTGSGSTADSIATPPPKEAEYYDELSLVIGDKVAIIDPMNPGFQTSQSGIVAHMYSDNLVYYTITNEYKPALATEWSANADATEYTFKLREGVKWHNGETFTADDVVFTVEAGKEALGSTLATTFAQVAKVEKINDYEVKFTLEKPNFDFVYDISSPTSPVVCKKAYEDGSENPGWIGTGPYYIESMVPNDSITYAKFDDYWGETPAYAKKFVLRYIAEETARLIMFDNDEVTFCGIGSVYIPQYEAKDDVVINSYVMNNCNYLALNMRKPITGDKNFRLAVAYAINRQDVVDIALGGYGQIVDCGAFWGNNSAYKNRNIPRIDQDLDKAKEYLAASCYNGEEIEICAGMAQTIKAAQVYQEQLHAIGINAKVHEFDGPSLTAASAYEVNDLDIIVNSGVWTPLASSCKAYLTPGNPNNKACYENQEVVDLIEKAAGTPDGPERQEMYYKIQEIVADDMPYIGTHHMALYTAAHKGAGGAIYFATNNHDYSEAYRMKNPE